MQLNPIVFIVLLAALPAPVVLAQDCDLSIASLATSGKPGNLPSGGPSLSFNGRFVAFTSSATDLVAGDTNGQVDCFVADRRSGIVERVNLSSSGAQANGFSTEAKVSEDGHFVVFLSKATNLDPKDTDTVSDVYLHDRVTQTTVLVSERLGSGIKLDGCIKAEVSGNGRYVVFLCADTDVLPGVPAWNAYVRDTWSGTTEVVSIGPAGQMDAASGYSPDISDDGRFVVFLSTILSWGTPSTGAQTGLWLRDRQLGTTVAITLTPSGEIANCGFGEPAISGDGRYVAFWSCSSNLLPPSEPHGIYDIVRWDRLSGEMIAVSSTYTNQGNPSGAGLPGISNDGTKVVFYSGYDQVTPGPPAPQSVYLTDLETKTTRNLQSNAAGDLGNASTLWSTISGDGRTAAFDSYSINLVRGITTNATQVYVRSCDTALPMTYCVPTKGSTGCAMRVGSIGTPSASAGSGFQVRLEKAPAQAPLLLFYGTSGDWGTPYGAGWLCVKSPLKRAVAGASAAGANCAAPWSTDFNAYVAAGVDGDLVAGAVVHLQGWARNSAGEGQLSDALALVLEP